jgi:hypothetical protein
MTGKYKNSLKNLSKGKHSSLFGLSVSDKEKKSFIKMVPGLA